MPSPFEKMPEDVGNVEGSYHVSVEGLAAAFALERPLAFRVDVVLVEALVHPVV